MRGIFPPGRAAAACRIGPDARRRALLLSSRINQQSSRSTTARERPAWISVLGQVPRGSKRPELHNFHLQAVHRWAILAPVPCRSRWRRCDALLATWRSLLSRPAREDAAGRGLAMPPGWIGTAERHRVAAGGGKDVRAASGGAVALALISAAGAVGEQEATPGPHTTSNRAARRSGSHQRESG